MKEMTISNILLIGLLQLLTLTSCDANNFDDIILNRPSSDSVSNYFIRTFHERTKVMPSALLRKEQGKLNAIKKAYQMTEFPFTPVAAIWNNIDFYYPNVEYKGLIYSSVKEIGTYVGSNVSFYTFATAVRNRRSKLYTERINEPPYHGINCRAYYGTVCSALVSYALGISYGSYDFVDSDLMEDIHYQEPEDVEVADILWLKGHVAIITDISYSADGKIETVEISESIQEGCVRRQYSRAQFDDRMHKHFKKTFRYKYIENNTKYLPCPEIVPVAGEEPVPIKFVDELCVDKGDRSDYLIGEDVVINIFSGYDSLVIYKDDSLFSSYLPEEEIRDITLIDLPYGNYCAKHWFENNVVETSWSVIDYQVSYNKQDQIVSFKSNNSLPVLVRFCTISGARDHSAKELFYHSLTDDDRKAGSVYVPSDKILDDAHSYVQVKFKTEYGYVSTRPIKYQDIP